MGLIYLFDLKAWSESAKEGKTDDIRENDNNIKTGLEMYGLKVLAGSVASR